MMYRENDTINAIIQGIMSSADPDFVTEIPDTSRHEIDSSCPSSPCSSPRHLPTRTPTPIAIPTSNTTFTSVHKIWIVTQDSDIEALETGFHAVDTTYIADGHHRSEAACATADKFSCRYSAPTHKKQLMTFLFPHSQLCVLPFHRCVRVVQASFMRALHAGFHMTPLPHETVTEEVLNMKNSLPHHMSMYMKGQWFDIYPKELFTHENENSCIHSPDSSSSALSSLDVQILVDRLFLPVFGSSSEIDMNVIYVPCSSLSCGVSELQAIVDSGEAQVAFHIQSISVFEIMRLADADVMLPPKATCFAPKPLSGALTRLH